MTITGTRPRRSRPTSGRVLMVTKTDFTDPKDGGTLRVSAIVRALEDAGVSVDAVAVRAEDGGRHPARRASRRQWAASAKVAMSTLRVGSASVARWYSPSAATQIVDQLRSDRYDAVLIEYSQLLIYRGLVGSLPVLLDMHNVEYELLANYAGSADSWWRRTIARYEAARVRRLEHRARGLVAAVTTVSERDAAVMRRTPGDAVVTPVPNGVSESAFGITRTPTDTPTVVFIAHLGWQPNVDAAHWLVERVWPTVRDRCPAARLQLIGRRPARSLVEHDGRDGISVHADVPSTLPYLGAATVATAPLLAAGGTRLKILEAMATGTPVVATTLGALGLERLAGPNEMLIADHPDAFADAIVDIIGSQPDERAISQRVDTYRWSRTLAPLVDAAVEMSGRQLLHPPHEEPVHPGKPNRVDLHRESGALPS